nr:non-structural protein 5 [Rotavirus A]BEL13074.1 non-structural protein 5 [Rotavirus A]BET99633.1 non-structual protein 5 [Avian rotavirus A]BET99644.1 non-structual protein 5 [Avian rotavirus A]
MSAITIDLSSLPSFSQFSNNESSSDLSNNSSKSVSRSEQYVTLSDKAFSEYMLNKDPEDIGPSDSASNDLPTKFAIKANAVKSNANVGVSLDTKSDVKEKTMEDKDEVDFSFTRNFKMNTDLAASITIDTHKPKSSLSDSAVQSTRKAKQGKSKVKKPEWPRIDYQSDDEEYICSDSEDRCCNCVYKRKYFELRKRMKQVAIQLIEDM